jgi:hypothetical protein
MVDRILVCPRDSPLFSRGLVTGVGGHTEAGVREVLDDAEDKVESKALGSGDNKVESGLP